MSECEEDQQNRSNTIEQGRFHTKIQDSALEISRPRPGLKLECDKLLIFAAARNTTGMDKSAPQTAL
jgi:hypothetical protein